MDDEKRLKIKQLRSQILHLKHWFNSFYAEHEQKYRRLIALGKTLDNGANSQDALTDLYSQAEDKRKEIQALESELDAEFSKLKNI